MLLDTLLVNDVVMQPAGTAASKDLNQEPQPALHQGLAPRHIQQQQFIDAPTCCVTLNSNPPYLAALYTQYCMVLTD